MRFDIIDHPVRKIFPESQLITKIGENGCWVSGHCYICCLNGLCNNIHADKCLNWPKLNTAM